MILEILYQNQVLTTVEVPDHLNLKQLEFAAILESKMNRFGNTFNDILVSGLPVEIKEDARPKSHKIRTKKYRYTPITIQRPPAVYSNTKHYDL